MVPYSEIIDELKWKESFLGWFTQKKLQEKGHLLQLHYNITYTKDKVYTFLSQSCNIIFSVLGLNNVQFRNMGSENRARW